MRKLRIILPIITFVYLFVGAFFFLSTSKADEVGEEPLPTVPTVWGWTYDQMTLDQAPDLWVGLYNPAIDEAVNEYVGEKICSVELGATFPSDLLEVQSLSFNVNDANNYSNETGVINFKAVLNPCTTRTFFDLFDVVFKTKQIGAGTIQFTKFIVTGGQDGETVLQSGIYSDLPFDIVPVEQYYPEEPTGDPFPEVPANIPQPQVETVNGSVSKSSTSNVSSSSAAAKTVAKTENKGFRTPTLTKLEFGTGAVLDKIAGKSQGAVFAGTVEPNSKVYILIHSQSEIYTDTTSDADGSWNKTITGWLEDGGHTITIWSEKDNKISPKFSSPFVISSYAKDQIAIGETYPEIKVEKTVDASSAIKEESKINLLMKNKFFWVYIAVGLVLIAVIFILTIKSRRKNSWDDDTDIFTGSTGGSGLNAPQPEQGSTDTIYPNTDI